MGIYFAWLGVYTKMLLWTRGPLPGPALLGLATEIYLRTVRGPDGGLGYTQR